jgi:hypothetical protein
MAWSSLRSTSVLHESLGTHLFGRHGWITERADIYGMASYSAVFSVHKTLVAGTADAVTLTGGAEYVEVFNRTGSSDIFVTVGQPVTSAANLAAGAGDNTAAPVVPIALANDTYVIPAAITSRKIPVPPNSGPPLVIGVESAGAMAYSVVGLPA